MTQRAVTYHCLNCRLAQRAEVLRSSIGISRGRHAARADANTRVAMLLALKRCPRCGHFDRGVAKHNRQTVRVAEVFLGLVLAITALCLLAIPSVPQLAVAVSIGTFLLAFAACDRLLRGRYPQNVERRVILTEHVPAHHGWWR
jgi:hypothetical protein